MNINILKKVREDAYAAERLKEYNALKSDKSKLLQVKAAMKVALVKEEPLKLNRKIPGTCKVCEMRVAIKAYFLIILHSKINTLI